MSLVAEFAIPSDAVPGGRAFDRFPRTSIELERIVPSDDAALPFFWVFAEDPSVFSRCWNESPK